MDAQRRGGGRCAAGCCPWAGTFVRAMALVAMMMLAPSIAHSATATLTLSSTTITFPSAGPDSVPQIAANQNPLQVTVRVSGSGSSGLTVQLSVLAGGNLRSGANSIAISNVTWTAQGTGFVSGTMSSTTSQRVGQWSGRTNVTGSLQLWLANSWSYASGNYSQTAVYTLTAN